MVLKIRKRPSAILKDSHSQSMGRLSGYFIRQSWLFLHEERFVLKGKGRSRRQAESINDFHTNQGDE